MNLTLGPLSFYIYEQWSWLFRRCNWLDFTWVKVETEWSSYKDSCEIQVALLGVGGGAVFSWDKSKPENESEAK